MSPDDQVQSVLAMAERLIKIFEADIAALEAGRPRGMASLDPVHQQLIVQYGKAAATLAPPQLQALPAPLRARLKDVTARFRETLIRHTRMVVRVKNCSEGLIKAVADEVEKRRNRARPYGGPALNTVRPGGAALIYNAVV